jgi:hypothetical protein
MPIGKYKGKTLDEIAAIDLSYLEWAASALDPKVAKPYRRYLEFRGDVLSVRKP